MLHRFCINTCLFSTIQALNQLPLGDGPDGAKHDFGMSDLFDTTAGPLSPPSLPLLPGSDGLSPLGDGVTPPAPTSAAPQVDPHFIIHICVK